MFRPHPGELQNHCISHKATGFGVVHLGLIHVFQTLCTAGSLLESISLQAKAEIRLFTLTTEHDTHLNLKSVPFCANVYISTHRTWTMLHCMKQLWIYSHVI